MKTFKDSIITNFHDKKVPKEKIQYKCLSTIVLDSVIKTDNIKYYPQTFLEQCVYKQQKQKQQKNYITEELKSDSDSNNESKSESESETDRDSNDDETKSDIDND